jgi:filamentous hemagglutinin
LKKHHTFPGQVLNDTALFHRAQDWAGQGYRTQVYVLSMDVPDDEFRIIQNRIFNDAKNSPLSNKSYTFPGPPGCYNCATYPSSVGMSIPEESGNLVLYIEAMKNLGATPWSR